VTPPFGHGGPAELRARLDAELRERIEEAVDFVCLDALVRSRRARGLPAPAADHPADREEFTQSVHDFLELLGAQIAGALSEKEGHRLGGARAPRGDVQQLVAVQVRLAKELPDYWQRFEAIGASYAGETATSRGERRPFLQRLLGRG
jgi:hypothetical protein